MVFDVDNHKALSRATDKRMVADWLVDSLQIIDIKVTRLIAEEIQVVY